VPLKGNLIQQEWKPQKNDPSNQKLKRINVANATAKTLKNALAPKELYHNPKIRDQSGTMCQPMEGSPPLCCIHL
jgi:hypothetical protein